MKAIEERLTWIAHFLAACQRDGVGNTELLRCAQESLRELLAIAEALPERETVTVLQLEDGDRILVRTDKRLDVDQLSYIKDTIKATFGDIPILVVGPGLDLSVVRDAPTPVRRSPDRIMILPELTDA